MPNLPTVPINNQVLYDRTVAAFPGATGAEKAKAYRIWVRANLRTFVLERETQTLIASKKEQLGVIEEELIQLAFDPVDNPPPPPPEEPAP